MYIYIYFNAVSWYIGTFLFYFHASSSVLFSPSIFLLPFPIDVILTFCLKITYCHTQKTSINECHIYVRFKYRIRFSFKLEICIEHDTNLWCHQGMLEQITMKIHVIGKWWSNIDIIWNYRQQPPLGTGAEGSDSKRVLDKELHCDPAGVRLISLKY